MPNLTIYLSEHSYVKLSIRAQGKNVTAAMLARRYVEKGMEEESED